MGSPSSKGYPAPPILFARFAPEAEFVRRLDLELLVQHVEQQHRHGVLVPIGRVVVNTDEFVLVSGKHGNPFDALEVLDAPDPDTIVQALDVAPEHALPGRQVAKLDRFGERVPISLGFLMIFVGYLIFVQVTDFIGFAITWAFFGASLGLLSPAYQSLVSKVVPKENLGIFTGMFRSSLGLISLPAPWIGAKLWDRYNPRVPFIITGILALISVLPVWFKFKLPDEEQSGKPIPEKIPSTPGED